MYVDKDLFLCQVAFSVSSEQNKLFKLGKVIGLLARGIREDFLE